MKKTILYPFSTSDQNTVSYLKTLTMASEVGAKVVCFTAVTEAEKLDDVYLHLLQLNGHYQSMKNKWKAPEVPIENAISIGKIPDTLSCYLNDQEVDILIHQSPVTHLKKEVLTNWLEKNSNRIVFL